MGTSGDTKEECTTWRVDSSLSGDDMTADVLHVLSRIVILDLASCPVLSLYSEHLALLDCVTLHSNISSQLRKQLGSVNHDMYKQNPNASACQQHCVHAFCQESCICLQALMQDVTGSREPKTKVWSL